MEKINVFDVQVPDGRQIRCMSYNKVTYFDLDDICKDLRMYASNPGCCIIMFFSMSDKVYFPEIT